MVYGDNQTRHFYVISKLPTVREALNGKFRLKIKQGGSYVTSDIMDPHHIREIRVSKPAGMKYRKWNVALASSMIENSKVKEGSYSIYFYVEDMNGFGIMDRFDRVITYVTDGTESADDFYTNFGHLVDANLNQAGFLVSDFTVTASSSGIEIKEIPHPIGNYDIINHNLPHQYKVIVTCNEVDGTLWMNNLSGMNLANPVANPKYLAPTIWGMRVNGVNIADMEHYFARNRGDLYDMNACMYTAIVNDLYADMDTEYYVCDIKYFYQDTGNFSYNSEKEITFACTEALLANQIATSIFGGTEAYTITGDSTTVDKIMCGGNTSGTVALGADVKVYAPAMNLNGETAIAPSTESRPGGGAL